MNSTRPSNSARARTAPWIALLGILVLSAGAYGESASSQPYAGLDASASIEAPSRFYPMRYYPGVADSAAAGIVRLAAGESADGLLLSVDALGGTVVGQVTGDGAGPLAGLLVEAIQGSYHVRTRSGPDGRFRLTGVPPGEVRVRYSTDDPLSRALRHRALWHPGVEERESATRVFVVDGAVTALDALELPRAAVLGGVVRGADTEHGLSRVSVRIWPVRAAGTADLVPEDGYWLVRSDDDGRFLQGGLPNGDYRVQAVLEGTAYISEFYGGSRTPAGAEAVTMVAGEERTDLEIVADRGGVIRGEVRRRDDFPLAEVRVEATRVADGALYASLTDDLGSYAIGGLPTGAYLVFVPILRRYYPDSVQPGGARLVQVVEPDDVPRINLRGDPQGGCELPSNAQGVITGQIQAEFAGVERAIVRAWAGTDTVEAEIELPGPYLLGCLRAGEWRVVFLADGPLSPQFHRLTGMPGEALPLTIAVGDTAEGVDFRPEQAVRLSGQVVDRDTNTALAGALVRAVELDTRFEATAITDEMGVFSLDRLEFAGELPTRAGLPAGRWRIAIDTTFVPDPELTPILQPSVEAEPGGAGEVVIRTRLLGGTRWSCRLTREEGSDEHHVAREDVAVTDSEAWWTVTDRPGGVGPFVYRLDASLLGSSPGQGADAWIAWSEPVFPGGGSSDPAPRLRAFPRPWDGRGELRFDLLGGTRTPSAGRLRIHSAAGIEVASLRWPIAANGVSWDGRDRHGRLVASGVYFCRIDWERASGSDARSQEAARGSGPVLILIR